MKFTKVNNTIVSGKVLLRMESWENDGDNHQTVEAHLDNIEHAEQIISVLRKHKRFGNGEWNPNCSAKERDIIGDWVGFIS